MSFRGNRGGGGGRGGGRGGRGGGGRGGGGRGGGFNRGFDQGPPSEVIEAGAFSHPCENDLVVWSTSGKIPFFNAQIYFENIEPIGKVDEIFGGPQENGFTIKLNEGLKPQSFKKDQKVYIDPAKLLPVERFTNPSTGRGRGGGSRGRGGADRGRGGGRGGGFQRGSRGGDRGGRGNDRGNRGRGGFGGRDSGGYGGRGGFSDRGNRSFNDRGNDRGGRGFGQKRFSSNNDQPQNKRIKFDD